MNSLLLPPVIFVGGKKKSGKDFVCDALAPHGFKKVHIAEGWNRMHCADMGIDYDTDYLPNKAKYRAEIQRRAKAARDADPDCLIKSLPEFIGGLLREGTNVAVSGIRFTNEALYAIEAGFFVVKVSVSDEERRGRFINDGEDLSLFDDPFESEIDGMPHHVGIVGNHPAESYPVILSAAYTHLRELVRAWEVAL